jgi:murein DD-endopeptidase MepM/ murein hydrolase activator NlpD
MDGERPRKLANVKDGLMQAAPLLMVLIGSAAIAAPAVHKAAAGTARATVTAAVQQAAALSAEFQAPAPARLIWEGADVDGDGAADFANPTGKDVRTFDAYGEGEFGARRDGGSRRHEGVDFIADAGQRVVAPISGYVTKIGYAYSSDPNLKFIEITNPALRYQARVFYVTPSVSVGDTVALGRPIGRQHSLVSKYPGGMTDHVHLEVIDKRGVRIDATEVIVARHERSGRARG